MLVSFALCLIMASGAQGGDGDGAVIEDDAPDLHVVAPDAPTRSTKARASASAAQQDCILDQDRAGFCQNGTAWSAGPCDGGEFLVCEPTHEWPNVMPTVLQAATLLGLALPPLFLAGSAALVAASFGVLIYSFDQNLNDTQATHWRDGSLALSVAGFFAFGSAFSLLATSGVSAFWLWRQGLDVVTTKEGDAKRITLFATGVGPPSPLASYRSNPEHDCYSEMVRLASEDHFFKVAEIWTARQRSLLSPLDPWKSLPRLPERTPLAMRMTTAKCQAQLEAGAARIKAAMEEAARAREELRRVQEQARLDLLECSRKTSTCTCNCSSQGGTGVGGLGGTVELGPSGSPGELLARLSAALYPDVKVADQDGLITVPLKEVILFETDKDVLTAAAWSILSKAANVLLTHPQIQIVVEGHTSAPGSAEYNQDLSTRRAKAVVAGLISLGVTKSRISMAAFGKTRPTVPTDKEEQRNRRVLIRLLRADPDAPAPTPPAGTPPSGAEAPKPGY